jgi:DNA polymerase III subunit delta'
MDWNSYIGHQRQRTWFRNAVQNNRLASTFLMVGVDGIGKRTFARLIAKTMLCTGNDPSAFAPCSRCEACAQIDASSHPDLIEIARRPDKTGLVMEQLVGEGERRMREGLCYELRMKPYSGRRKIAIVDDADTIAEEGANSLLKTLEEPPPGSLVFLISNSVQRQLPTIRSRCQMARFQPLGVEDLSLLILRHGHAQNREEALELAAQSGGSMSNVSNWTNQELKAFRVELFHQLIQRPLDFTKLAKAVQANMDSVGTETQSKRERLKVVFDFALQFYRSAMGSQLNSQSSRGIGAIEMEQYGHLSSLQTESFVLAIQRCIDAREHLDRMVSPAALIESWAADLAVISCA